MSIPTGGAGDREQWMTTFSALEDDEVDALFDGQVPDGAAGLDDLVAVVRRLRASAASEPVPPMSPALRAQILETDALPRLHGARVRRSVRTGLLVAAAAAAVALIGVGAEQNRLPADVQDAVSSAAGLVGIDVPDTADRTADDGATDAVRDAEGDGDQAESTGEDGTTPGGATPADPGEPGDKEPAIPATPPEHSGSGGAGGVESTPGATAPGKDDATAGADDAAGGGTEPTVEYPEPAAEDSGSADASGNPGGSARDDLQAPAPSGGATAADTAPGQGKKAR